MAEVRMKFRSPGPEERRGAIGSLEELPSALRRAFEPSIHFVPMSAPRSHDWLAVHEESGQTFDELVRSVPNRPESARNKLYFRPLGVFPEGSSPSLERLRRFAGAFFQMEVRIRDSMAVEELSLTTRKNPSTGKRQILTGDVLKLMRKNFPADAFCALAITMEDLYPDPS